MHVVWGDASRIGRRPADGDAAVKEGTAARTLDGHSRCLHATRHVFDERLNQLLAQAESDDWLEELCRSHYAENGRTSISPRQYFRMLMVGYFEAIEPTIAASPTSVASNCYVAAVRWSNELSLIHVKLVEGDGPGCEVLRNFKSDTSYSRCLATWG